MVFSGWSILNIGISPLCTKSLFNPVTSSDHFHLSNFNWNLFNAGIAGLSHYSVYTNRQKTWSISELNKRKKRLERALTFNVALDFIYIASGLLLKHATSPNDLVNYPAFHGSGNSLILQGGFLLVYDSSLIICLVDAARSAEPPIKPGNLEIILKNISEDFLVARGFGFSK